MTPKIGHQLAALRGKQPSSGIVQVGVVSFDTPLSLLNDSLYILLLAYGGLNTNLDCLLSGD